jgi:arsenate reductase-like glutaredoxin family protein
MDYALVLEVERRASGQAVHAMAQVLTRYSSAHQLLQDGCTRTDLTDIATTAERELRAFVNRQRLTEYARLSRNLRN